MNEVKSKYSIERLDTAQFWRYYVRGVGLLFIDSFKDLGLLFDTELKLHGNIISIVWERSGLSINLLNSTLCPSGKFMLTLSISHIRHLFELGSRVWNWEYILDIKLL